MVPRSNTHRHLRHFVHISLVVIIAIVSASCQRPSSWGLMLWDNDENRIPAGAVVPVFIRSNINQVWVIGAPEGDERRGEKFEVPLWQMEPYGSRARAESQAVRYQEYLRSYAETLQDGLPIRSKPENNATSVYRLREKQIIKVLGETKGAVVSSGGRELPGKWLRVMTDDGTQGYTFSYRLRLFEKESFFDNGGTDSQNQSDTLKYQFSKLVSRSWYPPAFLDMIENGQVDLAAFSRHEGLHFDESAQTLRWTAAEARQVEDWGEVSSNASGTWRFADGRVQIQIISDSAIQLVWPEAFSGSIALVALPVPPSEIISRERERRTQLLEAIWRRGPVLDSSDYGRLALNPRGSFQWAGYERLVPEVIPAGLSGNGTAEILLFIDRDLRVPYTGTVRFNFTVDAGAKRVHSVDFFYALDPQGLRLQYIPPSSIDGHLVRRRDPRAPELFFVRARE